MKFRCLVIDPPWSFTDGLKGKVKRSAQSNYNTLPTKDICELPIKELADPEGCVLALWVPASLLSEGLEVMKSWQFSHKQICVWVKSKKDPFKAKKGQELDMNNMLNMGMGRLFRGSAEVCLIGINNTGIYKKLLNKSQRSVGFAPNEKHSKKPDFMHKRLEVMFGPKCSKLEVFGRQAREGWTVIGNQAPDTLGEDVRVSLTRLIEQ